MPSWTSKVCGSFAPLTERLEGLPERQPLSALSNLGKVPQRPGKRWPGRFLPSSPAHASTGGLLGVHRQSERRTIDVLRRWRPQPRPPPVWANWRADPKQPLPSATSAGGSLRGRRLRDVSRLAAIRTGSSTVFCQSDSLTALWSGPYSLIDWEGPTTFETSQAWRLGCQSLRRRERDEHRVQ